MRYMLGLHDYSPVLVQVKESIFVSIAVGKTGFKKPDKRVRVP